MLNNLNVYNLYSIKKIESNLQFALTYPYFRYSNNLIHNLINSLSYIFSQMLLTYLLRLR